MTRTDVLAPGPLQNYVVGRMSAGGGGGAWLDGQERAPALKAFEMSGALTVDGPNARISGYSEEDWARGGDVGFEICSKAKAEMLDVFKRLRVAGGRTSGRLGQHAAYGFVSTG